jgi:hypothetical protein
MAYLQLVMPPLVKLGGWLLADNPIPLYLCRKTTAYPSAGQRLYSNSFLSLDFKLNKYGLVENAGPNVIKHFTASIF